MRIGMLVLVVIGVSLSGCAMLKSNQGIEAPCGVTDYIETAIGTVITGVSVPTDENGKKYNIVTPKSGFWMSLDCHDRLNK